MKVLVHLVLFVVAGVLAACGSPATPDANGAANAANAVQLLVDNKTSPEGSTAEARSVVFDLRLASAVDYPISVDWETQDDTAAAPQDYQAGQGTVTFAAGETLQRITVDLVGDEDEEVLETFFVSLSSRDEVDLSSNMVTGSIANDDSPCNAPLPTDPNPWLVDDRVLINFSHRGGALEYPENTMYSYKKSVEIGSDVLEMDVYETADGQLVVIHDATVDRTTESTGNVNEFTVAELKAMDAAYRYVDGRGAVNDADESEYVFRGVATGDIAPPAGYSANDFTIPTLEEILQTFPNELINIELKPDTANQGSYEQKLADLLKAYGRTTDVIVASFIDPPATAFKAQAPCVSTSYPTGQAAAAVIASQGPGVVVNSGLHHSFQVPPALGLEVVTADFVSDAHDAGLAVHVWTINSCDEMVRLLDLGVDAIMTDRPGLLEQVLAQTPGNWSCEGLPN